MCACAACCCGYYLRVGSSWRNTSLWRLYDFSCCCSCYCLPRTSLLCEGQELLAFLFGPKNFRVWIHCSAWSNLMQEIQFLEFMGRSNSTHARWNYLICMRFIRINWLVIANLFCGWNKMEPEVYQITDKKQSLSLGQFLFTRLVACP